MWVCPLSLWLAPKVASIIKQCTSGLDQLQWELTLSQPERQKERSALAVRPRAFKERASQWLLLTEGIFFSTLVTRIPSGDLLLAVALLALDQGFKVYNWNSAFSQ
eukprot:1143275-Pelagomonas_calceolata.AAC.3